MQAADTQSIALNHIPTPVVHEAQGTSALAERATAMQVASQEDYAAAGELVREIAAVSKQIEARRKAITTPMDAAKKAVMDFFRGPLERLQDADKTLSRRMLDWKSKVERERREAEALAAEAARKERERLEKQAAKAEEKGRVEQAAALAAAAQSMPAAPVVHAEPPKAEGVHTQVRWRYRVIDESAIPREYLMIDDKKLGGVVRAMKDATNIPGIEAYPDESLVRR